MPIKGDNLFYWFWVVLRIISGVNESSRAKARPRNQGSGLAGEDRIFFFPDKGGNQIGSVLLPLNIFFFFFELGLWAQAG